MTPTKQLKTTYAEIIAEAHNAAGGQRAFYIVGENVRRALVAQAVLAYLFRQDEAVSDAKVRSLLNDLYCAYLDDDSIRG